MNFIGNKKSVDFLEKSFKRGLVSHAYLFHGPERLGKKLLAENFAKSLVSNIFFTDNEGVRKNQDIFDKAIFDMLIIEPEVLEKKGVTKQCDIKTEKIRKVQADLSVYPTYGKYKTLIIDDAHKMTISAQNALLKTLEEPNATSIIILVTHNIERILPTIQSRCQKIGFSLVSNEEMSEDDFEARPEVIAYAMGRPGTAKMLSSDSDTFRMYQVFENDAVKLQEASIRERLRLAEKYAKDAESAVQALNLWIWLLRKRKADYDAIGKIQEAISVISNTNANMKLVLENLFISL